MNSIWPTTYDRDIGKQIIQYMNFEDFRKHGWPDCGVMIYSTPIMDIVETINGSLEVMYKNKVVSALVFCPTNCKLVTR